MKKLITIAAVFIMLIFSGSCQSKTVQLLTRKWDCIQVENIIPPDTKFQSSEDSVNFIKLQSVLQSISWTFKNSMKYECTVGNRITVQGRYELTEKDKMLICTPESNNTINRYVINLLTENDLVLSTNSNNNNLVLHFKPN